MWVTLADSPLGNWTKDCLIVGFLQEPGKKKRLFRREEEVEFWYIYNW